MMCALYLILLKIINQNLFLRFIVSFVKLDDLFNDLIGDLSNS